MTTIVYKDGVVAWDSRTTAGDTIMSDTSNKCHIVGPYTFWCAGTTGDFGELFRAYSGDKVLSREIDVNAFVLDGGKLYLLGTEDLGIWRSECLHPSAVGSGRPFALAAMDCGKDAKGALKIAVGRDMYSGGKLHSKRVIK